MQNGVLLALLGYGIYAWGDGIIKSLGGHVSVFEIGLFNALFTGLLLFLFLPGGESWRGFWRTSRPWAVHGRALSGVLASVFGIYAFTTIPMAEVYAIFFLAPLFVTLMSKLILGEQVGPWRWAAVIAGFIGVLMVVRPGFRELELGHLAALVVAFLAAATIILMRTLADEKQTTVLGVLVSYCIAVNAAAAAGTGFAMPGFSALGLMLLTGVCTAVAHWLLLRATRLSPASQIAPTHYSQMIWAVLIGSLFFAEYPDWISILGLTVIAASGLLTLVRERIRLGTVRWNPFGRNRL